MAPYLLRGAYQTYLFQKTNISQKATHHFPITSNVLDWKVVLDTTSWSLRNLTIAGGRAEKNTFPLLRVAPHYFFTLSMG